MTVSDFVRMVGAHASVEGLVNPYNGFIPNIDAEDGSPIQRQVQLLRYLAYRKRTARLVLVAEAPGYQGARFSGIAMTSERLISGNYNFMTELDVFGREGIYRRTSHLDVCRNNAQRQSGLAEPTATVVWREIVAAGKQRQVVLWNTIPYHPHRVGRPMTNRPPTAAEIPSDADILTRLLNIFSQDCRLVAIGNVARDYLQSIGIQAQHVRHPANGGAAIFRNEINAILREL